MDPATTLILFATGAALTGAAALGDWRRRRAPDSAMALLPWHGVLFVGVATMLFMAAHGLALLKG